jgi:hypothetical protein
MSPCERFVHFEKAPVPEALVLLAQLSSLSARMMNQVTSVAYGLLPLSPNKTRSWSGRRLRRLKRRRPLPRAHRLQPPLGQQPRRISPWEETIRFFHLKQQHGLAPQNTTPPDNAQTAYPYSFRNVVIL